MLFLHSLCLGVVEDEDRAELWDSATAEVNRELLRGTSSTRALMAAVWRVMSEPVRSNRQGHASRWDSRRACERLFDVPIHAAMVALPLGAGVGVLTAAVGLPSLSVIAGVLAGLAALVVRSFYMVNREIRSRLSRTYKDRVSEPSARIVTAANLITLVRLIPIGLLVPILVERHIVAATGLLVVTAVADFVDGYVARQFKQETSRGKLFDPCVDRLVVVLAAIGLLASSHNLSSLVQVTLCLVLARDFSVVLLGIAFFRLDRSPIPNHKGHIASILGYIGVIGAYTAVAAETTEVLVSSVSVSMTLGASFVVGIWSLLDYQRAIRAGRTRRRDEPLHQNPPADKLTEAMRRLPEGLFETERGILIEIVARDPMAEMRLTQLVGDELSQAAENLKAARQRRLSSSVDELEEYIGYLKEILRRLS